MIQRIFVPLDGSLDAESVLPWLRAWNLSDSRIILFHCLATRLPKGEVLGRSRFETQDQAREYLEGVARFCPADTEIVIRSGSPGDRIVTAALQAEASLVVLGSSGEFGCPRTLGKVTEMVTKTCPRPVLLVKTPLGAAPRRVRRILAPLGLHARGDENMDILRGLAGDLRAEVILLHVEAQSPEALLPRENGSGDATEAQLNLMRQVWEFLKDSIAASDVRLNLIRQVWGFLKHEIAARTVMTKGSFVEETLSHEQSLDVDVVALAREERAVGLPWQSVVSRSERAVLLYEPKDLALPLAVPAARDRALALPQL